MGNPSDVPMYVSPLLTQKSADDRIRLSYNDVHKAIQSSAVKIKEQFSKSSSLLHFSFLRVTSCMNDN
jgi:hypothetical protein